MRGAYHVEGRPTTRYDFGMRRHPDVEIREVDTGGKLSFEFVACVDGRRVGRIESTKRRGGGYRVAVIHVQAPWRHQGVGTALYEAAAAEACRRRSRLFSDARNPNAFSNDFWEKQVEKGRAKVVGGNAKMPTYALNKAECPVPMLRNGVPIPDGYTLSPMPWIRGTVMDPEWVDFQDDLGLFHVTTRIVAVKESGALRSRKQLQETSDAVIVGLGGGLHDEAPELVSVTTSLERAVWLRDAIEFAAETARGLHSRFEVAEAVLAWTGFDDAASEYDYTSDDVADFAAIIGLDMSPDDAYETSVMSYLLDHRDELPFGTPRENYELIYEMEARYQILLPNWVVDEGTATPTVGFTAPWQSFRHTDPEEVSIVQLAVRLGAPEWMVSHEWELRFDPDDLLIVAVDGHPGFPLPVPPEPDDEFDD